MEGSHIDSNHVASQGALDTQNSLGIHFDGFSELGRSAVRSCIACASHPFVNKCHKAPTMIFHFHGADHRQLHSSKSLRQLKPLNLIHGLSLQKVEGLFYRIHTASAVFCMVEHMGSRGVCCKCT